MGDADSELRDSFGFAAGNDDDDDDLSDDQGLQLDADDMADSDDGKHRMALRPRPASAAQANGSFSHPVATVPDAGSHVA